MIELRKVSKLYGDGNGLSNISIKIEDGEFVFLVGPSGAGKSTFIKLILKEIEPDTGTIFFDGDEVTDFSNRMVPYYRRNIGVVFQDFRLLPRKTVYENVAFAMEAVHQKRKLVKQQVPHILRLVGIDEKADRYPSELSGGEAQRVAIARAIVNNPKLLIADEPTGNLDPEKSWEIMNLLNQINLRGTTVVMVTHAKDIVDKMGKRVIQIDKGRIVRDAEAGSYIDNSKKDYAQTQIHELAMENAKLRAREKKYQERLKRLGLLKSKKTDGSSSNNDANDANNAVLKKKKITEKEIEKTETVARESQKNESEVLNQNEEIQEAQQETNSLETENVNIKQENKSLDVETISTEQEDSNFDIEVTETEQEYENSGIETLESEQKKSKSTVEISSAEQEDSSLNIENSDTQEDNNSIVEETSDAKLEDSISETELEIKNGRGDLND